MSIKCVADPITLLLGMVLILLYSFDRFNTPPSNRALTTAARYYISATAYMLIYLMAYFVLLYYPNLMNWLLKMADQNINLPHSLPTSVVGAILLSIVIPKIPILNKLDSRLIKFLQNLAAIPLQALRLSGSIQEAKFLVPINLVKKIKEYLRDNSFDERDLIFEETDTAEFLWVKNTALILQLETWGKADSRFVVFFNERSGQFKRLKERYNRLRAMALNCFSLSRQIAGDEREDSLIRAVSKVNTNFTDQAEDLFKEICHFISQGVLKCQLTHGSRCRELRDMGFQESVEDRSDRSLNIDQMVTLYGILIILVLMNFILVSQETGINIEKILLKSTMIVSIFCISVYCAIYPKEKYAFFKRAESDRTRVSGYMLSGLASVMIGIPVCLFFKTLIFLKGSAGLYPAMEEAWKNFSSLSYPWMFMAFVTAPITSVLSDYGPSEKISENWWRFMQAATQAALTLLAAEFVFYWLKSIYPTELGFPYRETRVMVISTAVGFAIGFAVPYWYRRARDTEGKIEEIDQVSQDLDLARSEA